MFPYEKYLPVLHTCGTVKKKKMFFFIYNVLTSKIRSYIALKSKNSFVLKIF